jgi:putative transposase
MFTYFTEDECGHIGFDTYSKIDKVTLKIESIQDRLKNLKQSGGQTAKMKRLRRAWYRTNARASNLASDLHWKTIKFLLDRFDVLVAPKLNVGDFVAKESKLAACTKRRLNFLRHGQFRQRLTYKARVRGKIVLDLEEHGTTRTCSNCGFAHHQIGSSEVFKCPSCRFEADRDVNSAKNHALKSILENEDY